MIVRAIIQARMGSQRLPGKMLFRLAGRSVLEHVVARVRKAEGLDEIMVATAGPGHEAILGHCEALGVRCFVGDKSTERDVLRRFVFATADLEETDYVVRVCGDNPLLAPELVGPLVAAAVKVRVDYVGYRLPDGTPAIAMPNGYVAEVAKVDALEQLDWMIPSLDPRREHVTKGLYEQPDKFDCLWLFLPPQYVDRPPAAIDTREDLVRVAEMLEK